MPCNYVETANNLLAYTYIHDKYTEHLMQKKKITKLTDDTAKRVPKA